MPSILALVAAFLFALAAALQQKGALNLPELTLKSPASLLRLAGQTMWLLGTVALLVGYAFQAAALDRGRLAIIQPLLVMTIVFALPLGYFLTSQRVGRNEVVGAAVIVVGLALFAWYGDPAGGNRFVGVNLAAPIGLSDPAVRIKEIRAQMRSKRDERALDMVGAIAPIVSLLPDSVLETMAGSIVNSDVQASNVPVYAGDTFIAGAKVLRQYGLGPLPGVAMMVVLISRSPVLLSRRSKASSLGTSSVWLLLRRRCGR